MSTSTSHHSRFPVELYDLIIDELAASNSRLIYSNSHPELQTCLFVSRSFRHRACHHLFSGICIDEDEAPLSDEPINPSMELDMTPEMIHDQLKELVDIMRPAELTQESPCVYGIRPYIRHVHFGLQAVGAFDSDSDLADSEIARQSRVYALSILEMLRSPPSVLGSGPLKSFAICGRGSELSPEWNDMSSTMRSSLLDVIRCTEVSLSMNWICQVPRNILRGTTVRSVDFREIHLYGLDHGSDLVDLQDFPEHDPEGGLALLPLPSLDSATFRAAECLSQFYKEVYPKDPTGQTQRTLNKLAVDLLSLEECSHLNQISKEFPDLKTLTLFTEELNVYDNEPEGIPTDPFDIRELRSLQRIELSLTVEFERQIRPYVESVACSASYAFPILVPAMVSILRSCANDSVSEIWLSLSDVSMMPQRSAEGNGITYDLDLSVFRELDMLLSGGSSSDSESESTSASASSSSHTSPSNLFPSLRRCIIESVIYPEGILPESLDHAYDLEDPQQVMLMVEAERKKVLDFIRRGFPCLDAPSSTVVLDLRITFSRHSDLGYYS